MKGVVPAAGEGSRMGPVTQDKPKLFMEVDGTELYKYLLPRLGRHCDGVRVALGHGFEDVANPRAAFDLPSDAEVSLEVVVVEDWAEYENAYTLARSLRGIDDHVLIACSDVLLSQAVIDSVVTQFFDRDREAGNNTVGAIHGLQEEMTAYRCDEAGVVKEYGDVEGHQDIGLNVLHCAHLADARGYLASNPETWFPTVFTRLPSRVVFVDEEGRHEMNTPHHLQEAQSRVNEIFLPPDSTTW